MPVLENSRHELFAQAIVTGRSRRKAYIEAGFDDTPSADNNAGRLLKNEDVHARIIELQNEQADRVLLTLASAVEWFVDQAHDCMKMARETKDGSMARAATAAMTEAAKLTRLYPEKMPANSIAINAGGSDGKTAPGSPAAPGITINIVGNDASL